MAREKKTVHKVQMTEEKRNIMHQLLEEYDIQSAEDIQEALKDLRGGTIKEMMEAEIDDHLDMKNPSAPIVMITGIAIKPNVSTAAMLLWRLQCHRIADLRLILKSFKNDRKIFLISTARSYPCMPKE